MPPLAYDMRGQGVLPWDVRYALTNRKAQLNPQEIQALARNGFLNEAVYLVIKACVFDPGLQFEVLSVFVETVGHVPYANDHRQQTLYAMQEFVLSSARRLPADRTVAAGKLAQLSRQGFEYWDELYRGCVLRCMCDTRQTYLIGHATFVGLAGFVQAFVRLGKELRILIPEFATDDTVATCGYAVGDHVTTLPKDFPRTCESVIIDDMQHTGACERRIRKFWGENCYSSPAFELLAVSTVGVV